jgi:hypothetical protein
MANVIIGGTASGATALPVANTIDAVNDYIPIYTSSLTATQAINRNTYLGITGSPVGTTDTQTLTNKTLTSPTISGPTLSGTLTGTYTIGGTPTFPSSVVQLTSTQTLTNKTLTSPTINAPIITNATISADTYSGFTTSNAGTIYGIAVSGGQITNAAIANGTIGTTQLASVSVTPSKLATGAATTAVATSETTASITYVALTTAQTVTVNIGSNGLALVSISCFVSNSGANYSEIGFAISGTNTVAASDPFSITKNGTTGERITGTFLVTGLTAGSNTFAAQYRVTGGTGTFSDRKIAVVPL